MRLKYQVIERFKRKYPIEKMCKILEVSRSCYYVWKRNQSKPNKDEWLENEILICQQKCHFTYGYRRVTKWIYRDTGRKVNSKAVLRVMRKTNMLSRIRRARPYTHYKQSVHKYQNLLNRQFNQEAKNIFWATDITYLPTKNGMRYMCAVMDLCGKMILGYKISNGTDVTLVTDTIRGILKREQPQSIHSDQGTQFTSKIYNQLIREYNVEPSMSKVGCPYDNSAMENFFGTLKSECLNRVKVKDEVELNEVIDEYIYFYNYERINKEGLTPYEIRSKTK